jgi:hypothetical protein
MFPSLISVVVAFNICAFPAFFKPGYLRARYLILYRHCARYLSASVSSGSLKGRCLGSPKRDVQNHPTSAPQPLNPIWTKSISAARDAALLPLQLPCPWPCRWGDGGSEAGWFSKDRLNIL